MFGAVILVVLTYLLPVVAVARLGSTQTVGDGRLGGRAQIIGGQTLAVAIALAESWSDWIVQFSDALVFEAPDGKWARMDNYLEYFRGGIL